MYGITNGILAAMIESTIMPLLLQKGYSPFQMNFGKSLTKARNLPWDKRRPVINQYIIDRMCKPTNIVFLVKLFRAREQKQIVKAPEGPLEKWALKWQMCFKMSKCKIISIGGTKSQMESGLILSCAESLVDVPVKMLMPRVAAVNNTHSMLVKIKKRMENKIVFLEILMSFF